MHRMLTENKNHSFLLPYKWCLIVGALMQGCLSGPKEFYVALDGQAGNPGTAKLPFASLEIAQEAVRNLKVMEGLPQGGIKIHIKGGIYPIAETLQFTKEDAGTSDKPVIWQAHQNEEVILTGGKVISQFTSVQDPQILHRLPKDSHPYVLQAALKAHGITHYGELKNTGFGKPIEPTALEVFFKGKPMTLARYPNEGWMKIVDVPQTGDLKYQGDVANPGAMFDGIPGGRHFSEKYPELLTLYEDEPAVPKYNRIVRNVSFGGRWLDLYDGLDFETVTIESNLIADTMLIKWIEVSGESPHLYSREDEKIKKLLEAHNNRIFKGNPGIKDIEGEDFNLSENSPAFETGFKPIPFDQMGLIPDDFRKSK